MTSRLVDAVVVAFIGKQDPVNESGAEGPFLSALRQLPAQPVAALLLYVEGGSDRADQRNDALAQGTQYLRAEELRDTLQSRWPEMQVTLAEIGDDPSHTETLLSGFRNSPIVRTFREAWQDRATLHTLPTGGTPAMRELLTTLAVMRFFPQTRNWYAPDRGELREEFPLAAQAVALSGAVTAVRLGEYAVAAEQVQIFSHAAPLVRELLLGLQAYRQGEYREALSLLRRWEAPAAFQKWREAAIRGLTLTSKPAGALMVLWNEVQAASPRNAVLAYATLLETALQTLIVQQGLPGKDEGVGAMVNRLRLHGMEVPSALDATTGTPRELYSGRNDAIHSAQHVTESEAQRAHEAATDLLRSFPAPTPELHEFLRAPHMNAFAPQRRPELAELLHGFLVT